VPGDETIQLAFDLRETLSTGGAVRGDSAAKTA